MTQFFNPVPKPPRREKKERKPVKRANRKRKISEFARCYHSRERVRWVKSLPCVVCGYSPCDNAHTATGGMGRKADYQTIVPLCCMVMWVVMWRDNSPGDPRGHHGMLHSVGIETFENTYKMNLRELAAKTEELWQKYQEVAA